MNRTDRLNALVEELRAISPRCRSARDLGARFGVSARTIERDVAGLQRAGVPIYAEAGPRGGYAIDPAAPVPPVAFTPAQAVAVAVALSQAAGSPLAGDARAALSALLEVLPAAAGQRARDLAGRVRLLGDAAEAEAAAEARAAIARVVAEALRHRRVLRLTYNDRSGAATERDVEPGVFAGGRGGFWYLVGWCRLRRDVRVFRLDRITSAGLTAETAAERRELAEAAIDVPELIARDTGQA
ncbi:transcriptional regulator [Sphaerisporangium rufum]|uniref:Transcriptional regulator n=1 Tax=Sphaerisporangium rufum TaxID=1381558 RepID=A0A919V1K9_9ACTN|nr:WYL domain-containing protein [Sphaerisporangium rufum]GII79829.1 transcriptional regulator [Sphaerisporangium rufum]